VSDAPFQLTVNLDLDDQGVALAIAEAILAEYEHVSSVDVDRASSMPVYERVGSVGRQSAL
jgi:hypothetical protein